MMYFLFTLYQRHSSCPRAWTIAPSHPYAWHAFMIFRCAANFLLGRTTACMCVRGRWMCGIGLCWCIFYYVIYLVFHFPFILYLFVHFFHLFFPTCFCFFFDTCVSYMTCQNFWLFLTIEIIYAFVKVSFAFV